MTETKSVSFAEDRLQRAIQYAQSDFAQHEITRIRYGVWCCAQTGTLINRFYVTFSPGALMVHGDIGEILFVPHKPHALRWAKGVFRPDYIQYPFEKLSRQIKDTEYCPGVARENADYLVSEEEDPKRKAEMAEAARWLDCDDEHDYYEFIHEWADEPEGLWAQSWTFRTLRVYQALCWFMERANRSDERFREELAP